MTDCNYTNCPYDAEKIGKMESNIEWIVKSLEGALTGNGLSGRIRKLEIRQGWIMGIIAAVSFGLGLAARYL